MTAHRKFHFDAVTMSATSTITIGIDVGTSGVKLAVVNTEAEDDQESILHSAEAPVEYTQRPPTSDGSNAAAGSTSATPTKTTTTNGIYREQDAVAILQTVMSLLAQVPVELQHRVTRVGIAGQMHGCVMWQRDGTCATPLITWEDQRCDEEFLATIAAVTGCVKSLTAGVLVWCAPPPRLHLANTSNRLPLFCVVCLAHRSFCGGAHPGGVVVFGSWLTERTHHLCSTAVRTRVPTWEIAIANAVRSFVRSFVHLSLIHI